MNLNQIELDLYRRLGYGTTSPGGGVTTRLRAFINETQQELLSEPGMESLLNDSVTFASVASTPEYSLPQVVARVKRVYETTNDTLLQPQSADWFRSIYPDPTQNTGIPDSWIDLGFASVSKQPSDASELFVKSDSASDGATKTAFIEGYVTGGYFRSASVALNGITAASFSSSITTWIEITKFYVALTAGGTTTAAGNITLLEDSGSGTELARIPIGGYYARYRRIALAVCPSSAITYTVDFERDIQDMSIAGDEPLLPPRFHRLLVTGARMKEYEKENQIQRYAAAKSEFDLGKRQLKFYMMAQAAGSPTLRGRGMQMPSTLGAWFGAGT